MELDINLLVAALQWPVTPSQRGWMGRENTSCTHLSRESLRKASPVMPASLRRRVHWDSDPQKEGLNTALLVPHWNILGLQ